MEEKSQADHEFSQDDDPLGVPSKTMRVDFVVVFVVVFTAYTKG